MFSHNRLYVVKAYANKFTTEFMADHEIHFIGVIPSSEIQKMGEVINLATKNNLVIAKFFTTHVETTIDSGSSKDDSSYIIVPPRDTVMEFVGITAEKSAKSINFNNFVNQITRTISKNIIFAPKNVEIIQVTRFIAFVVY
jgi:hypothetical protein